MNGGKYINNSNYAEYINNNQNINKNKYKINPNITFKGLYNQIKSEFINYYSKPKERYPQVINNYDVNVKVNIKKANDNNINIANMNLTELINQKIKDIEKNSNNLYNTKNAFYKTSPINHNTESNSNEKYFNSVISSLKKEFKKIDQVRNKNPYGKQRKNNSCTKTFEVKDLNNRKNSSINMNERSKEKEIATSVSKVKNNKSNLTKVKINTIPNDGKNNSFHLLRATNFMNKNNDLNFNSTIGNLSYINKDSINNTLNQTINSNNYLAKKNKNLCRNSNIKKETSGIHFQNFDKTNMYTQPKLLFINKKSKSSNKNNFQKQKNIILFYKPCPNKNNINIKNIKSSSSLPLELINKIFNVQTNIILKLKQKEFIYRNELIKKNKEYISMKNACLKLIYLFKMEKEKNINSENNKKRILLQKQLYEENKLLRKMICNAKVYTINENNIKNKKNSDLLFNIFNYNKDKKLDLNSNLNKERVATSENSKCSIENFRSREKSFENKKKNLKKVLPRDKNTICNNENKKVEKNTLDVNKANKKICYLGKEKDPLSLSFENLKCV